jgi:hypothetical protein
MEICDVCYTRKGVPVPATETIKFTSTDERYHLCRSCSESLKEVITSPPQNISAPDPAPQKAAPKKAARKSKIGKETT